MSHKKKSEQTLNKSRKHWYPKGIKIKNFLWELEDGKSGTY